MRIWFAPAPPPGGGGAAVRLKTEDWSGPADPQTEVVPMLVRAPQNWTLNDVIPGVKLKKKRRRLDWKTTIFLKTSKARLKNNPFLKNVEG